jgi:hypothetical protein
MQGMKTIITKADSTALLRCGGCITASLAPRRLAAVIINSLDFRRV